MGVAGGDKKHGFERACVDFSYQLYNKTSNPIGNRQSLFMGVKYNFFCYHTGLHKQGGRPICLIINDCHTSRLLVAPNDNRS